MTSTTASAWLANSDTERAVRAIVAEIYFPAQRIHFARDDPRAAADLILINDPRLEGVADPQCATNGCSFMSSVLG